MEIIRCLLWKQNGTLKTASILDYEKGPSLSIRIQVKDEHNVSMAGAFDVTVTDANDWALGTVSILKCTGWANPDCIRQPH